MATAQPTGEIFYTLMDAKILTEAWRRQYNTVRPHSSLGYWFYDPPWTLSWLRRNEVAVPVERR